MGDLLALAFQSDLTRVATFVFANDGSKPQLSGHRRARRSPRPLATTAATRPSWRRSGRSTGSIPPSWRTSLRKLKSIREGDGTLLDHCMIVYGSGISDGNAHSHDELPILLAGKASGTVKTGRHVRYRKETPMTNLYLSMLDRIGAPTRLVRRQHRPPGVTRRVNRDTQRRKPFPSRRDLTPLARTTQPRLALLPKIA